MPMSTRRAAAKECDAGVRAMREITADEMKLIGESQREGKGKEPVHGIPFDEMQSARKDAEFDSI